MQKLVADAVLSIGLTIALLICSISNSHAAGRFDAEDSREIEEIVRKYILTHPEVILESVQKLQVQQQEAEEQKRREALGAVRPIDPSIWTVVPIIHRH